MRLPIQIRFLGSLAGVAALAVVFSTPVRAQESPAMPGQIRNQLNQGTAASQSSGAGSSTPADDSAASTRQTGSKPARMGHKGAAKPAAPSAPAAAPASTIISGRRDPFIPLLAADNGGAGKPQNLPPGKAGLMVDSLRIDGIVQGPTGMIAIVENPQERVYFLHEGDKLYDGSVTHIVLDAVSFHETGTDAFGKPVDRELTKRLNPSSTGDTQ